MNNYCTRACFGCIVNYFMQHQQTYVLSQYPTILYPVVVTVDEKGEDKYGKYHGNK